MCYRSHLPLPFIIITQPKSWYLLYRPTESGRVCWSMHCSNGVQPIPEAVYNWGFCDKYKCLQCNYSHIDISNITVNHATTRSLKKAQTERSTISEQYEVECTYRSWNEQLSHFIAEVTETIMKNSHCPRLFEVTAQNNTITSIQCIHVWLTVHFLLQDLLHGTLYRSNFVAHPLTARFVAS